MRGSVVTRDINYMNLNEVASSYSNTIHCKTDLMLVAGNCLTKYDFSIILFSENNKYK